ncbi:carbonic anhydrase [Spongiibacter sp. IMCC21906]|jgi:carbonic anhydrase|uniref:carbonic anhydrase n=1 Tax=Spongiibacter sp. IMCC21906 TaxID=1620392 RepID=UPI00062DFCA7|nr:carbonic anhydrase [Spongiibacter sp. IMCC21906]AKH68944.1 carbonic anhydrase [Spongiibacter sp. IMCC21906]
MITAQEALQRLKDGNQRFVERLNSDAENCVMAKQPELVEIQNPMAIVLGCSDARVPAEIVFDQGLGDLFVIRVAGNIVAPSGIGSVEFAALNFGTPLVVVLGHSNCGAVKATVDALTGSSKVPSINLHAIVKRVRPAVESMLATELRHDRDALIHQSVRANVRSSVEHLSSGSPILESLISEGKLMVVGAEYSLESGEVDFFYEDYWERIRKLNPEP